MTRVLVATAVPFWQRRKGNHQRIFELVRFLSSKNAVTVFYMGHEQTLPDELDFEFLTVNPHRGFQSVAWWWLDRLPSRARAAIVTRLNNLRYTRTLDSFHSAKALGAFKEILEKTHYDAIVIEYIWYGFLADVVDRQRSKLFLDVHDIYHRRKLSYQKFDRTPDKIAKESEEISVYEKFDYLISIQKADFDYLARLFPDKALLAMHPHRPHSDSYRRRLGKNSSNNKFNIVYFGSFSDFAVDAIRWFVDEIWSPELAEKFQLQVFGGVCDGLVLDAPGVELKGPVPEIADVYRNADIAINPIRFGSGLKIKNTEAMAFGVPLVTTGVGAEGLEEGVDKFFLLADDAEAFRAHLLTLTDSARRQALSEEALRFVEHSLSDAACFAPIQKIIEKASHGGT
jgi:glycosyltransferase involved in cell wall biosynthesis